MKAQVNFDSLGGGGTESVIEQFTKEGSGPTYTITTQKRAKYIFVYQHNNGFITNVLSDGTVSETDVVQYTGNAYSGSVHTNKISISDNSFSITMPGYTYQVQYRIFVVEE